MVESVIFAPVLKTAVWKGEKRWKIWKWQWNWGIFFLHWVNGCTVTETDLKSENQEKIKLQKLHAERTLSRDVRKLEDLLQGTTFFCFLLYVFFPASITLFNSARYVDLMFSFIITHKAVVSPVHPGFVCQCFGDTLQSSWAPVVLQARIMAAGFSPTSPELNWSSLQVPSKIHPCPVVSKTFFFSLTVF